jgi:hypothetical protein
MNKEYTIAVYDMLFYRIDEDGNEELNEDGSIKLYRSEQYDCSYLAEDVELDDLEEVSQRGENNYGI